MDKINFFPDNFDVQNQTIILRLDLNVPMKDKIITDDTIVSYGDVLFDENICRNIMVDIRYVLWVIDIYAGAGHLVNEMNLVE